MAGSYAAQAEGSPGGVGGVVMALDGDAPEGFWVNPGAPSLSGV